MKCNRCFQEVEVVHYGCGCGNFVEPCKQCEEEAERKHDEEIEETFEKAFQKGYKYGYADGITDK